MGVRYVLLLEAEGTGAFNSWNDYLRLSKRSNGSYYVSLRRRGIDTPGFSTLFQTKPFRRPSALLEVLVAVVDSSDEWFATQMSSPSDLLLMLAKVVEFDPPFAAQVLTILAERLAKNGTELADGDSSVMIYGY